MEKQEVLEAVKEGTEDFKKEVGKTIDEKLEAGLKNVKERLEKIEKAPVNRLFNIGSSDETFKGYKLKEQGRVIRNIAAKKPGEFSVFANEEKMNEFCKYFINMIKALKGDMQARAELI